MSGENPTPPSESVADTAESASALSPHSAYLPPEPASAPALADEPPSPADDLPPPSRVGLVAGFSVLIIAAVIGVAFLWNRRAEAASSEGARRREALRRGDIVRTAVVSLSHPEHRLQLLGETRPFASVTLYAKVSGYLRAVNVDVGDHVGAGQPLAVIESPETDRAVLAATVDYENKQLTAKRIAQLLERKLVSPQEADQSRAEADIAHERLESLKEQQAYETLRSPFAGVVTARFADPGALLQNAANSQTSALPVVTVSQNDRLRILAYLDQSDAGFVHAGTPAVITMTERPELRIPVKVSRVSGQLDPRTRKMIAEVDYDDRHGDIVPGSYVQIELNVPSASRPVAPVEALVLRGGKEFVGVVGADGRVHLRQVSVVANDGRQLTFASGVQPGDRLALSLGSGAEEGMRVQVDSLPADTASARRAAR